MTSNTVNFTTTAGFVGLNAVLGLSGELDMQYASQAAEAVRGVLARRPAALALDLRELSFIDSSGLHEVIRAECRCRDAGVRFYLIAGPPAVQRVLSLCGLDERFEILGGLEQLPEEPSSLAATA